MSPGARVEFVSAPGIAPKLAVPAHRVSSPSVLYTQILGCVLAVLVLIFAIAHAAEPKIRLIETAGTNQVVIHYDTEANRTYVLQYTSNALSTNWSNLHTGYNYPFPFQYHITNTSANPSRFYRLRVTTP